MEATTANRPAAQGEEKLRRTALGVSDIVFFIVAASAPLTVIAGGVASTYLVTGNAGVPLLFLVLGAVLALFVTGYAAMSHHITNAGAFYAYVSKGIGKVAGVGTSFVALIAYNSMQIGILGLFGAVFSGFMLDKVDINFAWYTWVFIAIAIIGVLGWLRVDLNAKVLAIFLTTEILVVLLFDLVVATDPGPDGLASAAFDPVDRIRRRAGRGALLHDGRVRRLRVGGDLRRGVQGAPKDRGQGHLHRARHHLDLLRALGVDARRARSAPRSSPTPTRWSRAASSASRVAPTRRRSCSSPSTSSYRPRSRTSRRCSSAPACSPPRSRSTTRWRATSSPSGRARVFPPVFARTRESGAPYIGSLAQTIIAVVVVAIFALSDNDPVLQLFTWLTNLGALGRDPPARAGLVRDRRLLPRRSSTRRPCGPPRSPPRWPGLASPWCSILVIDNFNLLITGIPDAPTDDRSIILPAILHRRRRSSG